MYDGHPKGPIYRREKIVSEETCPKISSLQEGMHLLLSITCHWPLPRVPVKYFQEKNFAHLPLAWH